MQRLADPRPAGAGLLVFAVAGAGPRYLLTQRGPAARDHQGDWDLTAGGHLEPGEDELDGALREHREELGEPPELLVIASRTWLRGRGSAHAARRYTAFLARAAVQYLPARPDPAMVAAWGWMSLEDAMRLPLCPPFAIELAELAWHAEEA
jgi:8-oxo-dGTP pyrophosphatase MutT (NUDIX family)